MKPLDRTLALNATHHALWWLLDPDHNRWAKTFGVLADPTARLTIEQGSGDNVGRRAKGDHSDPTLAAASAVIDAGLDCQRQARDLRFIERTIAESAAFLRSTIADTLHVGDGTIIGAIGDVDWCNRIPHTAEAWRTDNDELRGEFDHAIDHMHRQAVVLVGKCRAVLVAAVQERPKVEQPKRQSCSSCRRFGLDHDVARRGLCVQCDSFRRNHKVWPTEEIVRAWERGSSRITPGMIAEAKAAGRKKSRKAG